MVDSSAPGPQQPLPGHGPAVPTGMPGPGGAGPVGAHPALPPLLEPAIRWVWSLVGGLVAIGVVAAMVVFFVLDARARLVDQAAFLGSEKGSERLEPVTQLILGVVSVPFLIGVVLVAATIALVQRRWSDAIRAVGVVAGANLTTQLLKAAIDRPVDAGVPDASYGNSLPSGHTTVAASVAAAALIVAPRGARPVVALLGALYAAATGVATMSLGWHRPSDAIAAFAIVSAWSLLLLVPNSGRTVDVRTGPGSRTAVSLVLGAVALLGLVLGLVALILALRVSDGNYASSSRLFTDSWLLMSYVGSAAAVVAASALTSWALVLARR